MIQKYFVCNNCEQKLAGHLMQAYPNEGCGILLGRGVRIEKIKPAENLVTDKNGRTHLNALPFYMWYKSARFFRFRISAQRCM